MPRRNVDWDRRLGRQLKLRDLHVLFAVVEFGSMAKAAAHFSVTQPAISQAVADLERTIGVRLVDRGPYGVVPTVYGVKLLARGNEAFDALKLGMRDIEFLLDPGSGEVTVGADMSYIAGGFMSALIEQVARRHPNLTIDVVETTTAAAAPEFRELRERAQKALGPKFDLRTFHDEMLNGGTLPLDMLEARTDAWVAAQQH